MVPPKNNTQIFFFNFVVRIIRFNLPESSPSLFIFVLLTLLWCFYTSKNDHFEIAINLKVFYKFYTRKRTAPLTILLSVVPFVFLYLNKYIKAFLLKIMSSIISVFQPSGPLGLGLSGSLFYIASKQLGVFLLPPIWDASPLQGYPQH